MSGLGVIGLLEGSVLTSQSRPRAVDKKDVVGAWLGEVFQPYV